MEVERMDRNGHDLREQDQVKTSEGSVGRVLAVFRDHRGERVMVTGPTYTGLVRHWPESFAAEELEFVSRPPP
jgi:hypothetical protein